MKNQWKPMKTDENKWKSMKINEKTAANSLAANGPAANSLSIMIAFELSLGSTRRYHFKMSKFQIFKISKFYNFISEFQKHQKTNI